MLIIELMDEHYGVNPDIYVVHRGDNWQLLI